MAGFNPNRKKKTYSFNRSQQTQIVSASFPTGKEYFDLTSTEITYPFYQIQVPVSLFELEITGEYDEDFLIFNNLETASKSFNITFTSTPIITLQAFFANQESNVNPFILNVDQYGFTASLSAPLSGQILYRAIYAPTYPTFVIRNVLSSAYKYQASAGYLDITSDNAVLTYSAMSTSPTNIFITTEDINNNQDADVAVVDTGVIGSISTPVSLSAPINNRVHYLVVKSI